ncbi:phage tail protein [Escherichia coli]|uniref:phage tail protein n=1 Tax=Escherichia coli TaxID=562 RepID=UPI000BE5152F|nr:phage tail protein [Escherichia coli]
MRKISDITSYVDENDEFTDGIPESGIRPTPLLALWFNVIQREVVKVVESAGLTLDPTDDTQLWQALSKYFASQENVNTAIGALGTMASQNSDAVDITGGAITGTSLTGDLKGNADTATTLKTGRTIRVNLGSTGETTFDGSANVTPGVTGKLPLSSGGTGATTASEARTNLGLGDVATQSLSTLDTRYLLTSGGVSAVRLSSASSYTPPGNESSWTQNLSSGNVLTGIIVQDTGSNSADNIGGIYYRQVQYCINGKWINAVSL